MTQNAKEIVVSNNLPKTSNDHDIWYTGENLSSLETIFDFTMVKN